MVSETKSLHSLSPNMRKMLSPHSARAAVAFMEGAHLFIALNTQGGKMKHKAKLSISCPSYSNGTKNISIAVIDADANIQFLDIKIDLDKFSECLTGLGHVECEMEFRGLQNVGKIAKQKPLVFEVPDLRYKMKEGEVERLALKATPEGWKHSSCFRSKESFFCKGGKNYARTNITRWVDK